MKVAVFGLGKLGTPMAALFASRGHDVIGVDNNLVLLDKLRHGDCPIQETGLAKLLANVTVRFTPDYAEAVRDSDISFIMVPTPSNEVGAFKSDYVVQVARDISECLGGYHLVVVTSTVMPGTMENEIKPALEVSGKKCGDDFGLVYNPEFIALGSVIRDMSNPDGILIGESDKKAGQMLEEFLGTICLNQPKVCRMSWWNAEVAKLALNVVVTTKISLANTIAQVCSQIPTGNVDDVTGFLGLDSRIGSKFFRGGLGFGGECFPRDNRAFILFTKRYGMDCPIQIATDKVNRGHTDYVVQRAVTILLNEQKRRELIGSVVSVLGVTYKPKSPVVTESVALDIVDRLSRSGVRVRVYDPMGLENAKRAIDNPYVRYLESVEACLDTSDLCILATPWDEFKELSPQLLAKHMRTPYVLDCWRLWSRAKLEQAGIKYSAIGVKDAR